MQGLVAIPSQQSKGNHMRSYRDSRNDESAHCIPKYLLGVRTGAGPESFTTSFRAELISVTARPPSLCLMLYWRLLEAMSLRQTGVRTDAGA